MWHVIVAFALAAASWLSTADAQPAKARVAFLAIGMTPADGLPPAPLREAMRERGYVEGRNVDYFSRWADLKPERLAVLAREIVESKPDLIVAIGHPASFAAKEATTVVPIVATQMGDPVGTGLVASLAKPGGNVTGITDQSVELSGKRVELLKEVRPDVRRVAVLWNGRNEAMTQRYREIERAASALHVVVEPLAVRDSSDFDQAFEAMTRSRPDALLVVTDAFTTASQRRLLDFAARQSLPTMYESGPFVRNGGLISYGPPPAYLWRRVADYADRILKGAKPSNLPVEQADEYELVLNLGTARSLQINVPQSVFQRATEVVQ